MSPITRRAMMQLSAAAAGLILTGRRSLFGTVIRAAPGTLTHGILFGEADLPSMRALFEGDARFAYLREKLHSIDRDAEHRFIKNEVRTNDQLYHLSRLSDLAEAMAFLWLLTGETEAADLAAESVRTIMRFPHWDFFLEAGQHVIGVQRAPAATIAVSLVSDWLGDRITQEERQQWLHTMAERGCEPCFRSLQGIRDPRRVVGWSFDPTSTFFEHRHGNRTDLSRRPEITQTTNLRAVPAASLAVGALALRSHQGTNEQTDRWLEMAVFSLRAFASIYEPDGSYHEGASYAHYTSIHLATAISALQRAGGPDPGGIVNWNGYADYVLNMSMPTAIDPFGVVNFGDNGNPQTGERGTVTRRAVPYWIARRTRNAQAQWAGDHLEGVADIRSLIWFDPSVQAAAPAPGYRLWRSVNDRIVARTGYSADDLVVAMRSGPPANHEHADRNSIIVTCYGEQLVTDPNRPPYSFADPSWPMRLTTGHSAVLVDGRGHQYHNGVEGTNASSAHARILQTHRGEREAVWISDATQAYRLVETDIRSVVRGVVVSFDMPALIVVDRITKWHIPSTVQARFFGYNWDGEFRHELLPDGFSITRPGAVMRATVFSSRPVKVTSGTLPIPQEEAQRHPFVEVASVLPAAATTIVTVLSIARAGDPVPAVMVHGAEEGISVRIQSQDRIARCRISKMGTVPLISCDS